VNALTKDSDAVPRAELRAPPSQAEKSKALSTECVALIVLNVHIGGRALPQAPAPSWRAV